MANRPCHPHYDVINRIKAWAPWRQ
jgi:hypothetical protein